MRQMVPLKWCQQARAPVSKCAFFYICARLFHEHFWSINISKHTKMNDRLKSSHKASRPRNYHDLCGTRTINKSFHFNEVDVMCLDTTLNTHSFHPICMFACISLYSILWSLLSPSARRLSMFVRTTVRL